MTIIKKKSLIVALVSSFVISLVLVLTLIGYLAYIEIRGKEFERSYQALLQKVHAKSYGKYIDIANLAAKIENQGALKGKPIVEGTIKNNGARNITDLLIKVKFLDRDGAVIYEVAFHPSEPALGATTVPQVALPYISNYLYGPAKVVLKAGDSLTFKWIMMNCPREIILTLQEKIGFAKDTGRWTGKLAIEVLSIGF